MKMQILEKNLDKEAEKLGIAIFQLDEVIRHAQIKCGAMRLTNAMGLGDYHPEYDEWYFGDLQETVEIINHAVTLKDEYSFTYQSSW